MSRTVWCCHSLFFLVFHEINDLSSRCYALLSTILQIYLCRLLILPLRCWLALGRPTRVVKYQSCRKWSCLLYAKSKVLNHCITSLWNAIQRGICIVISSSSYEQKQIQKFGTAKPESITDLWKVGQHSQPQLIQFSFFLGPSLCWLHSVSPFTECHMSTEGI